MCLPSLYDRIHQLYLSAAGFRLVVIPFPLHFIQVCFRRFELAQLGLKGTDLVRLISELRDKLAPVFDHLIDNVLFSRLINAELQVVLLKRHYLHVEAAGVLIGRVRSCPVMTGHIRMRPDVTGRDHTLQLRNPVLNGSAVYHVPLVEFGIGEHAR